MSLFKPWRSRVDLPTLQLDKNLALWWQGVCDAHAIHAFSTSYQTRGIDKSIQSLVKVLAESNDESNQQRQQHLHVLHTRILNWDHMHNIGQKNSKRKTEMDILLKWVEKEIYSTNTPLSSQAKNSQRYSESIEAAARLKLNTNPGHNLYTWWKNSSNRGWFSRRSEATKELDKAIEWLSTNIVLSRLDALQNTMDAINVWLLDKQESSSRLQAVLMLKKHIGAEMAPLKEISAIMNTIESWYKVRRNEDGVVNNLYLLEKQFDLRNAPLTKLQETMTALDDWLLGKHHSDARIKAVEEFKQKIRSEISALSLYDSGDDKANQLPAGYAFACGK